MSHPSTYTFSCWAQASSLNDGVSHSSLASLVQIGNFTHTIELLRRCSFPHDDFLHHKAQN